MNHRSTKYPSKGTCSRSLLVTFAIAELIAATWLRADDQASLEVRAAALKTIRASDGGAWPDIEKLRERGVTWDFVNVELPFQSARFESGNDEAQCDSRNRKLADEAIAALAAFPELERLYLSAVTDDQLAKLTLRNLKVLELSDTAVTDEGIEHLRRLEKLESLDLARTAVTGRGFEALDALKNLRSINLDHTPVTDAAIGFLAELPHLAEVHLNETDVGDLALENLRNNTNLEQLGLQKTRVSDVGLVALERLNKLTALNLDETCVGDTGIEAIAHLPRLTHLSLVGTRITDASTSIIARWTDLAHVDLSRTAITDYGVKRLRGLTKLVSLRLRGVRLSHAVLQALAEMDKLEALDLADTPISDAGLDYFKPLVSLRELDLSHTKVVGPGLESLEALPRLGSVKLAGTQVGLFYLNRLKVHHALNEKTDLDFANQPLGDVVEYLSQRHEIGLQLDYRSLRASGVAADTPITMNLKGITLREALETMLKPLGLAFANRHEVLLIGAKPLPESVTDFPVAPPGEPLSPKLAAVLAQPAGLEFTNRLLNDLVAELSKRHSIDIEIDANSLAADIKLDAPLTRFVKDITLKSALELLLVQLNLICVADGDKLVIRAR